MNYESVTYGADHKRVYREFRNEELARILRAYFSLDDSLRILDVGCGTGLILEYLSSLSDKYSLFGIDGSQVMLNQARNLLLGNGRSATLSLGTCDDLPFADESLDVVVATRFIHLFDHEDKKRIYTEFLRVLRPGGIVVVEYYARSFAWVRYYLMGAWRHKERNSFFSHYPTKSQVGDILESPFQSRPIRLAGSRVLVRLFGEPLLRWLTQHTPFPNQNLLVDEYFVVTRK
ncbi:MAG: class I SAM-dependent methyltransferase [Planctomycetota bacterium]